MKDHVPVSKVCVRDVHQGSALSPYLFFEVMHEITKGLQVSAWCMMFTDDIALVG